MHPDIIIRNSTRLLNSIRSNTLIDGIFAKCWEFGTLSFTSLIMSDFYAYRVAAVNLTRWTRLKSKYTKMEHYTSHVFRDLVQLGRVEWLNRQQSVGSQSCRVDAVDIVHYHLDWQGLLQELKKNNIIMTAIT